MPLNGKEGRRKVRGRCSRELGIAELAPRGKAQGRKAKIVQDL